jgi:hypothetical protein
MHQDPLRDEITNPKLQIPNKSQISNPDDQNRFVCNLSIGIYLLFGVWDLVLI